MWAQVTHSSNGKKLKEKKDLISLSITSITTMTNVEIQPLCFDMISVRQPIYEKAAAEVYYSQPRNYSGAS